jgi:septal ring factor EnvC (AmiA/AmiB activator)
MMAVILRYAPWAVVVGIAGALLFTKLQLDASRERAARLDAALVERERSIVELRRANATAVDAIKALQEAQAEMNKAAAAVLDASERRAAVVETVRKEVRHAPDDRPISLLLRRALGRLSDNPTR